VEGGLGSPGIAYQLGQGLRIQYLVPLSDEKKSLACLTEKRCGLPWQTFASMASEISLRFSKFVGSKGVRRSVA
jgi:hypothetical protein